VRGRRVGDAVLDALTGSGLALSLVQKLAVRQLPGSATPAEQLQLAGIDATSIASTAADLVGGRSS
jgi:transketolase